MLCTSNNNGNNDGQQQQFLHPSQVPPQLHSHIILVYFQPLARLSFLGLGWHYDRCFTSLMLSDLSLSHCLVLFISPSLNPPCFQISFFFSSVAFHPARERKKGYIFFYLSKKKSGRCRSLFVMLTSIRFISYDADPPASFLFVVCTWCVYIPSPSYVFAFAFFTWLLFSIYPIVLL